LSIQLFPWSQFPQQRSQLINSDGSASQSFWYFLRALWNRTGMGSGITVAVGNDLTAVGTSQANALPLTDDYNEVLHGSGAGVALAALQPGQFQIVFNGSGGNINVYPDAAGSTIDGGASYLLGNASSQEFWCTQVTGGGARVFRSS
jgi:hypothetical protein